MQKDFHYYCIVLIALAAGYLPEEIKTIAYASQYVDDETIDTPVYGEGKRTVFRPIRTAYHGIEYGLALLHRSQIEVLVPFHFIPNAPYAGDPFSYRTERDSAFARGIVRDALASNGDNRLHRIGIALHTFADTWAHQSFSGIREKNNEVDKLKKRGKYGSQFSRKLTDVLDINIGHICALSIPDYPYEVWGCKSRDTRTNLDEFTTASEEIFGLLLHDRHADDVSRSGPTSIWQNNILPRIKILFSILNQDTEARCREWRKVIRDLGRLFEKDVSSLLDYDEHDWKDAALSINTMSLNEALSVTGTMRGKTGLTRTRAVTDWDKVDKIMNKTYTQRKTGNGFVKSGRMSLDMGSGFEFFTFKPDYKRSDWYRFQTAAKEQRDTVLKGLPR